MKDINLKFTKEYQEAIDFIRKSEKILLDFYDECPDSFLPFCKDTKERIQELIEDLDLCFKNMVVQDLEKKLSEIDIFKSIKLNLKGRYDYSW